MEHKIYIQAKIDYLQKKIKNFRILSIVLFLLAISIIVFAFITKSDNKLIPEFGKFGFGLINFLLPFYLESLSSKAKERILNLRLISDQIDIRPELANKLTDEAIKNI